MENIKVGSRVFIKTHTLSNSLAHNRKTGTVFFIWHHTCATNNVARVTLDNGGYADVKVYELEIEEDGCAAAGWTDEAIEHMDAAYAAGAFQDHMSR